jgi:hypothetical protein
MRSTRRGRGAIGGVGAVVASVIVCGAGAAQGGIVNGGFTGSIDLGTQEYPGWTHVGLINFRSGVPPTFEPLTDDIAMIATAESFTGQPEGAVSPLVVATFLGDASLAPGISAMRPSTTFGSAIKQTFTAAPGESLTFEWNLTSADADFVDFAFVYLNGPGVSVLAKLADSLVSPDNLTPIYSETSLMVYNSGPLAGGTYTIGIGAFNATDNLNAGGSALMVDNVVLTAVPEPVSGIVMLVGVMGALARPLNPQKRARRDAV